MSDLREFESSRETDRQTDRGRDGKRESFIKDIIIYFVL